MGASEGILPLTVSVTTSTRCQHIDLCSRTVSSAGSGCDSWPPVDHRNAALAVKNRNPWRAEIFQSDLDLGHDLAFARRRDRVHPQGHLPVCSNEAVIDKQPTSPGEKRMSGGGGGGGGADL